MGDSICSAMGSQGLEVQGDPTVMGPAQAARQQVLHQRQQLGESPRPNSRAWMGFGRWEARRWVCLFELARLALDAPTVMPRCLLLAGTV